MYIETSSPRQQGDKAVLNSPQLQFSGSMCLKFYYHMYGSDIGTLNVIINGNNVFAASGDQGNMWQRAAIDVSLSGNYAVREIIVSYGRCIVYCYPLRLCIAAILTRLELMLHLLHYTYNVHSIAALFTFNHIFLVLKVNILFRSHVYILAFRKLRSIFIVLQSTFIATLPWSRLIDSIFC